MTKVFIGIDVGTQGTKAIAYRPSDNDDDDTKGRILARASANYPLLPTDVDGRAEQDPDEWIAAVRFVLRELVADLDLAAPASISSGSSSSSSSSTANTECDYERYHVLSGIGISGQQHGMVLLDSDHEPLRPAKLWCDVEASAESERIKTTLASAIGRAGKWDHVVPSFTSPKALWTIGNEPDVWERVRWCVLPHDYVNLVLRGDNDGAGGNNESSERTNAEIVPTTDRGDASGSGIFDPNTNRYCAELVGAIDPSGRYARSLPTILDPLDICGNLSEKWMKDIGLRTLPENDDDEDANATTSTTPTTTVPCIPISAGSGDNMCSALGVGCASPGTAVLSLGTSGTIFGASEAPPSSSEVSPFADACGRYLPLACVMSCTGVLNSVLDSFFNGNASEEGHEKKWTHADATELAVQHPPGCHGITFLPYLTPGERTPNWPHASGAILGLTASNMAMAASVRPISTANDDDEEQLTTPANPMAGLLYRAAMEGITYLLSEALSTMKQACGSGFRPTDLLVVGGGSQNELWRQMLADVTGMELRFPKEKESAALGAAFQVGAAAENAARRKDGGGVVRMEEYVERQLIELEDGVVVPTEDERTLRLYREGGERYRVYAAKLFDKTLDSRR